MSETGRRVNRRQAMTTADTAATTRGGHYRTTAQDDEQVSDALVRAVATAEGCDPLDLDPLYHAIDPDTIDALFDPVGTQRAAGTRTLTIAYHGHDVTVTDDGHRTGVIVK